MVSRSTPFNGMARVNRLQLVRKWTRQTEVATVAVRAEYVSIASSTTRLRESVSRLRSTRRIGIRKELSWPRVVHLPSLTAASPLTPTVAIWVQINHPVPNRVKPSIVIFDTRALWRSALSGVGLELNTPPDTLATVYVISEAVFTANHLTDAVMLQ